jgi:hypothetical protein
LDDAVNTWLINNPFIFQDGDSLCGAVFIHENCIDRKVIGEKSKQTTLPGLKQIRIFHVGKEQRIVDFAVK